MIPTKWTCHRRRSRHLDDQRQPPAATGPSNALPSNARVSSGLILVPIKAIQAYATSVSKVQVLMMIMEIN